MTPENRFWAKIKLKNRILQNMNSWKIWLIWLISLKHQLFIIFLRDMSNSWFIWYKLYLLGNDFHRKMTSFDPTWTWTIPMHHSNGLFWSICLENQTQVFSVLLWIHINGFQYMITMLSAVIKARENLKCLHTFTLSLITLTMICCVKDTINLCWSLVRIWL